MVILGLIILLLYRRHQRKNKPPAAYDLPRGGKGSPTSFSEFHSTTYNTVRGPDVSKLDSAAGSNEKNSSPISTIVPLEVDQRLDPGKMYMQLDHNDSIRSLKDDHDYSRKVLRVTNPDNR